MSNRLIRLKRLSSFSCQAGCGILFKLFSKLVLSFALPLAVLFIPYQVLAETHSPLDKGIYGYGGLGFSASALVGSGEAKFKPDETTLHTAWDIGFMWKRYPQPGRRSMLQLAYRPMKFDATEEGQTHSYERRAYSLDFLESYAFINRFSPFVGISLNYDELKLSLEGGENFDDTDLHWGFVGGWDLMPSVRSKWMIRSVFRWYPDVVLTTDTGEKAAFPNFEYNFFQFVFRFN